MHIFVLNQFVIMPNVNISFGECHLNIIKYWRFVHIYPIIENIISVLKFIEQI